MTEVEIQLNGQPHRVAMDSTVAELLDALGARREGVAVAIDRRVVPRSEHTDRRLQGGEVVELITAVGGG